MSSGPRNRTNPLKVIDQSPPRTRLKPAARAAGWVDGSWWPHSRELTDELPALFAALHDRLGVVGRVAYHLTEWPPTPRRMGAVRLEGFLHQPADTIGVTSTSGDRLTLLVIPPETTPVDARTVSDTAVTEGNADSVETLLSMGDPR